MSGTEERFAGSAMQAVSNTMVKLHKEQFGRGPTNARSYFAGPDTLVCTLEDSLLPAERTMVEMGEDQHVRESRMFLQVASRTASSLPSKNSSHARSGRLPAPSTPPRASSSRSSASNQRTHAATDPRRPIESGSVEFALPRSSQVIERVQRASSDDQRRQSRWES